MQHCVHKYKCVHGGILQYNNIKPLLIQILSNHARSATCMYEFESEAVKTVVNEELVSHKLFLGGKIR